jgi:predicted GTPase
VGFLDRLWKAISEVQFGDMPASVAVTEDARKRAQAIAPVVWLLGKTGAGKTAIVAALTGDPRAEVGEGFDPCTRTAAFYDVPPEAPLLRFLDTRGLGESDYDPATDIAWCEGQSHLLLVVMQVADPVQHAVLHVLRQARRRHPDWPVVVAQTGLHRLYPQAQGIQSHTPIRAARRTRRTPSCRTHCGRQLPTSAGCSKGCPARDRVSCR